MNRRALSIRQLPMVIMAVLFMLGIIVNDYLDISIIALLSVLLCTSTAIIYLHKDYLSWQLISPFIMILIFFCGTIHTYYQKSNKDLKLLPHNIQNLHQTYGVELLKVSETALYTNLIVKSKEFLSPNYGVFKIPPQRIIIKIKKGEEKVDYPLGSYLTIKTKLTKLSATSQLSSFDYETFLSRQGLAYLGYAKAKDIDATMSRSYPCWKKIRYDIRFSAIKSVNRLVTDENSNAIIKALLLGYKNDLDEEVRQSFINSGTIHILAVSGLHVGIVAFLLFYLVRFVFFWLPRYSPTNICIVFIGLIFYAELSGGAAPVWRAVIVTILYLLGRVISYESHPLNTLGLAATALLLYDYQYLFNLSFQLSFLAVTGIVLIYPILERVYTPKRKITKYIVGIAYMGIAAQTAIIPLSFYYFNQISVFSPLTSILAIPSAFVLIICGTILLTLGWIHPIFINVVVFIINKGTDFLTSTANIMSQVKTGIISNIYFNPAEALIVGLALLLTTLSYYNSSFRMMRYALFLFAIQGVLQSTKNIQRSKRVNIVYHKNPSDIAEIHIGKTAYINNDNQEPSYQQLEARKSHLINKLIRIDYSFSNIKEPLKKDL